MKIRMTPLFAILISLGITAVPALAGEDHTADVQQDGPTAFADMAEEYLAIQTALAADSIEGIGEHAMAVSRAAATLKEGFDPALAGVDARDTDLVQAILPKVLAAATELSAAKDVKAARAAFGDLSQAMVAYRDLVTGDGPNVAYCPMAKKSWLQNGKQIANPYFGSSMLRCGNIVEK